ncbi:lipopolysaccharide-responsive and beige-like anchor protein isoform X2 [Anguilla anguilla]|uniref:lipopolysaccharide-responsive and beige-like anchor protein isoform X2 n=1 Tax=Anguilla anguilla TaxID=7936 RepID=UPI0015A78E6B|nr:lipopolysaccharide-responsive and beige-like anchor protein isoform X2 [Anguilla anguilla]
MASEGTSTLGLPNDGSKNEGPAILPINAGVPIRGIRMKFAVLTGLVEVGEVSNRDILETVFNLLVGGQFDLELNFVVQQAESVTCMVELLDKCEPTCQAEVWSIFSAILRKSLRNLQACTEAGLIEQLLTRLHRADCVIADLMVDMLGALASYSITPHELKLFFSKLQGEEGKWPPHAVKLLSVLNCIAHRNGPDAFFSFPGKSAAAIALPPIAKWPYLNGFTFQTWMRLDPLNTMNLENDKPYLYCFRTGKGLGYSAHFVAGCLTVTAVKSKGKGIQHCVKYDFKPQKWYMVTIVHVYHRWKNSEIWCYVNGELASCEDVNWSVSTNDTFDKCFLGSSETADSSRVFSGQMGAVYVFSDSLNAAQVLGIYQLGPSYKGTFNHSAESDLMLAEHHKMVLYDGKLLNSIAFAYNPRATDAQLCLDSSCRGSPSIFVHSPHALMLQDVRAVLAPSVQSAIHSIGGVQALFPLFGQLDYPQHTTDQLDTSICHTLLSFLMELLKNSVAMQEQLLASKGFLVIGYSLEKSSEVHVTQPILDIFIAYARYLSNLPNGVVLLKQLCDHILFNPVIWIHSSAKVQQTLYTYLATEFVSSVAVYSAVRRVGTVVQIMHTLKYYYWAANPQERSGVTPRGLDGPRPTQKEILSMRAFLLLFIKQLIVKDHGVREQELQSILNYLLTMHEDDNLIDVLQLLVAVMSEQPGSMVPTFDRCNGIRVIYKLLASKDEGVRVQALKVLGYFLKYLPPKRKSEIMLGHGLFSLLSERLILHAHQSTLTTYNVLFEILTEKVSTQVIRKQHLDPDSAVKIVNPQILKVIAALLKNSPQSPESMEVRRIFLSDMIRVFSNSRENRRSLLQCSVWQEWMLSLCYVSPRNNDEQKVTEMVYALFRILLYHAIKYEWGGWRVWVDTLSITHSKVTFEQHKDNLVSMLQEYERGSTGDGLGPIRTVSGSSLSQSNGEHAVLHEEEERAPSTIIELTVEGDGEQGQALITVPDILNGAVVEELPAQVEGQELCAEPLGPATGTTANDHASMIPETAAQTAAAAPDKVEPAQLQEEATSADTENTDDSAVATDDHTETTGDDEEATGDKAEATGDEMAAGDKVEVAGDDVEAACDKAEATGDKSETTGDKAEATGDEMAAGDKAEVAGDDVEAACDKAEATGDKSETTGDKAEATGDEMAAGDKAEVVGDDVEAAGDNSEATGDKSETAGDTVEATGDAMVAAGDDVEAAGDKADATGDEMDAGDKAEVAGDDVEAAGDKAEAAGDEMEAAGDKVEVAVDKSETTGDDMDTESSHHEKGPLDVSADSGQDKAIIDVVEDSSSVSLPVSAEKGEQEEDEQGAGDEAGSKPKEEEQQVSGTAAEEVVADPAAPTPFENLEEQKAPTDQSSQPPSAEGKDPPGSEISQSPTTEGSDPPSSESSQPPTTEGSDPPSSESSQPPTTEGSDPPPTEGSDPPITEGSDPPTTEGSDPPSSESQDPQPTTPNTESPKKTDLEVSEGAGTTEAAPPTPKAKEMKIAQLDVTSVAADTAKTELKEQPSEGASQGASADQGKESSSTGQETAFHIPQFQWSHMHQRLLTDLLFAIETDIQMWRSHSTKSVTEFVNSSENIVFVHNTVHLVSQIVDNLVVASGGILPLLSAATSSSRELESVESSQGLAPEAAVTFLQRLMSLADVLIFASSLNFAEVESEKNMSPGGILRQSLRLVCTIAVRNCLDCQQQQLSPSKPSTEGSWSQKATQNMARGSRSMSVQCSVDMRTEDQNLLMHDMDINRLRAAVFRDTEDSKQAQFLALAVVYFVSVLMVSKYRDILEPHNERRRLHRSQSVPCREVGQGGAGDRLKNGVFVRRRDSGIGEEPGPVSASEAESGAAGDTGVEGAEGATGPGEPPLAPPPAVTSPTKSNVRDILRSLISGSADKAPAAPGPLLPAFLGPGGDAARDLSMQFRSFDRSVVVAPKKGGAAASAGSGPSGTPVSNVAVVSSGEATPSASAESAAGGDSTSANLPAVPNLAPLTHESASRMSISERLDHALERAAPLLREIFVDFTPFLSRTLLGSHGQELLNENTSQLCIKSSSSVVELVMLLCSQEWQNSIQKNAGMAFIELVNEGSLLSHNMKDHLVRVAKEAEFILNRQRAEDLQKHREFEAQSAEYSAEKCEEERISDHLIRAVKYRDHVTAGQLIQKIVNILMDKRGAWGSSTHNRPRQFWRLDYWEDDLRRRRRFVRNPSGSAHSEASPRAVPLNALEEDVLKGKQSIRSQALGNQNSESELLLDGDGDALSSLEDKELENLTGSVNLSTGAQLVAPAVAVRGTLSITASELYFEVDEEEPSFKKIDPKILVYTEGLHGKWLFSEVRAVFSRRYLLQNTALEIFMANRTSIMFNFPDSATVKKVVHRLPRVGVGTNFGLPQTRRISLASPRQLYKASSVTQRWQRREISNFEYLIFLNTISGRTYNDLSQYPVFPWVIANYDTNILDLTMPSTYRDLSKPIGALNPKRAAAFSERFESWEDEQVPKFHYSTHYSTAGHTLTWLQRIEPFTTFLLNFNEGQFDHPDQTFSSVSKAWRSCQRNASDVKELIPEFYYLPEMFVNSNNYALGVMADGTPVSDVDLPPWAKTPEEFVRTNRLALESEYVSSQLHQWVDLVFGCKQKGPEAGKALNVFYHLTYEGAVDLSAITDPALREAAEAQIQRSGQTPCQLLSEPHAPRSSSTQATEIAFGEESPQDVIMVLKFPSNSPVVHVSANTQPGLQAPAIITVTANRLFAVNKWHGLLGQVSPNQDQQQQLPVEIDPLLATSAGCQRRQVTDLLDQSIQVHSQCFIVTADNRFILLCGFWDRSLRVYSTDSGKLAQIVFGHWDVVTCLARSESYIGGDCYVLSGSRDATLLLWYWNGKSCCIGESAEAEFVTPRAVLSGHDCEVTCASVCAELGLAISGSREGLCLIHTMNGDLLWSLEGPESSLRPRLIQSSTEGHCVVYYDKGHFCVFSVNGRLLVHAKVEGQTKAILLSRDGHYMLSGGDEGVLNVWQVHDLKHLFSYPGCDAGIRSMAMSHDQRCIITGMSSGSIVMFHTDFNRWHHEYQSRY